MAALKEYGVLTALDRTALSQYCFLYSQLVEAPESFSAALHAQLRLVMIELGLTASSRSKLNMLREDENEDYDPLA